MSKRKRCDWWSHLRDEIVGNGGLVHPGLVFSECDRALSTREKLTEGEVVLRIPAESLVTKDRALSACRPWLEAIVREPPPGKGWKNSPADLSIAVALASHSSRRSSLDTSGRLGLSLYHRSLPDPSGFDSLPRRWTDEDIRDLLAGTSLLERAVSDKKAAIEDYRALSEAYYHRKQKVEEGAESDSDALSFPTFEAFSDMLAAVTSRAFQIGGAEEDVALVPILDLGNHTRGGKSKSASASERPETKKNLAYRYDAIEGAMIATAAIDVDAGESIRLTYGAKANAELLLHYGFCLSRNLEPDGSSNDVLEFRVDRDSENRNRERSNERETIALRAGPKSYSYGGFVAALEEYFEGRRTADQADGNDEIPSEQGRENETLARDDDFEAFLNECDDNENDCIEEDDDDEEEGDGFTDLYGGGIAESEETLEARETSRAEEIEALERFKLDLIELSNGYNNCKRADIRTMFLARSEPKLSRRYYATILSLSELRTIYFFGRSIEKVQGLLRSRANAKESSGSLFTSDIGIDREDLELIDAQTDDLAEAYMAIRHGGL